MAVQFDKENTIAARYICKKTGVFIDIFSIYENNNNNTIDSANKQLNKVDLYPMLKTNFLKNDVYIPRNTKNILLSIYKNISIPKDKK